MICCVRGMTLQRPASRLAFYLSVAWGAAERRDAVHNGRASFSAGIAQDSGQGSGWEVTEIAVFWDVWSCSFFQ
jgi:hypothetical protein